VLSRAIWSPRTRIPTDSNSQHCTQQLSTELLPDMTFVASQRRVRIRRYEVGVCVDAPHSAFAHMRLDAAVGA
jgi:hypothetical protein